ncbi:MAG: class I SAM-dependent methyltransferase [Propionibacteriaceae bacterium]|jgi:SAM-dependent methyltransferase|nr:class I SAM-dependent methyltransferase [Propionibacteriaceae bacterium]
MDADTAMRLAALTSDFYARRGPTFSATRDHPWRGWSLCLPHIDNLIEARGTTPTDAPPPGPPIEQPCPQGPAGGPGASSCSVLDIACGNLRFLDYLTASFPATSWSYCGVDNATTMVAAGRGFHVLDIMAALFRGDLEAELPSTAVDLSVCFGFLHHVPGSDLRKQLVTAQVAGTRPGGLAILTAWQFALDTRKQAKAATTTERANRRLSLTGLDDGDYLLGWDDSDDALRYCHSFSDAEIDDLVAAVADQAQPIARFRADGKSNAMNTYLVFQVK